MARQQRFLLTAVFAVVLVCGAAAQPFSRAQLRPAGLRKLKLVELDSSAKQTIPGSGSPPTEPDMQPSEPVAVEPVALEPVAVEEPTPEPEVAPTAEPVEPEVEPTTLPAEEPETEPVFVSEPDFEEPTPAPEMAPVPEEETPESIVGEDVLDSDVALAPEPEFDDFDELEVGETANGGPGSEPEDDPEVQWATLAGDAEIERTDLVMSVGPGQTAEEVRQELEKLAQRSQEGNTKDASG